MDDSLNTPLRHRRGSLLDNSISCTPNPQATSTVTKCINNSFELETQPMISQGNASSDSEKHSNFLSGAIDDLRILSHQLEAFGNSNSDSENVPPQSYKSSSARSDSVASRRSSGVPESVGNSSLGILNVNELDCDALNVSRTSSVFSNLGARNLTQADDTFDWKGFSSRSILTDSNFASSALSNSQTSVVDVTADLRLRMQRALAQRALKRASEKSQSVLEDDLAELDSLLPAIQPTSTILPISNPDVSSRTPSRNDDALRSKNSFVVEVLTPEVSSQGFPFSPHNSAYSDLSKESFVSGELALNRIEQDQDSWRKNYGCFPSIESTGDDDRTSFISSKLQNVTKNMDLSLSGVISGDVTVSSSLEPDTEKRRLSAGEYFGLRSENLGLFDAGNLIPPRESMRPNFGKEIHSPTRARPMPLVENSQRLSDVSLDKVPMKDTGLDRRSLDSFDFTFDTSTASNRKSTDLMPPPPPPSEGHRRESNRSKSRRSLQVHSTSSNVAQSKRLSMSMNDVVAPNNDADVSFLSMDESGRRTSNQTVASLSHIAQLLSDMSGHMSTRLVVDNLLENCSVPSTSRSKSSAGGSHSGPESSTRSSPLTVTPRSKGSGSARGVPEPATPTPPKGLEGPGYDISVKQRVTEWMSRADVNAEKQHVHDELATERILASNSPALTSTPRQSMYSDISSAGLSDKRAPSPQTPTNRPASSKGSSSESSRAKSTPTMNRSGTGTPSEMPRAVSAHSKVAAIESPAPSAKPANENTPSICGSAATIRSSSRHGDTSSLSANSPFNVDSTHTQLSWASVPIGSSKTQSFALKNKANGRIRLLVVSGNPVFKLLGERGESVTELVVSMHCEEARRINVVFSPNTCGAIVSRLVISRMGGTDVEQRRERRLIPLYGTGGQAQVNLEGAPKDQWAQWFVNLTYVDGDLCGATFCARNSGDVPAFVQAQISTEGVPFSDCGVTISPSSLTLVPGQSSRFSLRWEPKIEVLEWLSENAGDVHVLANVWLSWAELSTWQRITRLFHKYYKKGADGPLSNWVPCILGETSKEESQAWQQLKDNKGTESFLVQSVRRIKVAVLGEREMLRGFDLDASVVFQQLTVNDTILMCSPSGGEDCRKNGTLLESSPVFSNVSAASCKANPQQQQYSSPQFSSPHQNSPQQQLSQLSDNSTNFESTLNTDLDLTTAPVRSDSYVVRFPATIVNHKTCAKITFKNFSTEQHRVAVRGVTEPFQCPTSKFSINGDWYLNLRVFFQPRKAGTVRRLIEIWVDGEYKLTYELIAEGIASQP